MKQLAHRIYLYSVLLGVGLGVGALAFIGSLFSQNIFTLICSSALLIALIEQSMEMIKGINREVERISKHY